jgi:hypothetical protein
VILPREVLFVVPFWMLLAAAGVERIPLRWGRGAAAAALVAIGVLGAVRPQGLDEAVVTARTLSWVRSHAHPGEPIAHAETHSLLFFLWHAPDLDNRMLEPAGQRVPYFEGGLVVPDSVYVTPEAWARETGEHWGVWVDRAFVTRGRASRAGAENAEVFRSATSDSAWHLGPVTVWRMGPASPTIGAHAGVPAARPSLMGMARPGSASAASRVRLSPRR